MTIRTLIPAIFALAFPAAAQDKWIRLNTSHFEMYTTSQESKARDAILHFERVREFFLQASPVRPPGEFPTRIIAFKDAQMMHVYAPNQSVEAFFAPGPLRDSIVMKDPSPESYPVTIHEYVHLVIRHSGLHLPLWLNEGWAEVYSTMKPVKDGVAVGDLIPRHITSLATGRWFSLEELQSIDTRSRDYNESARTGVYYAESWALTHMLYLSPGYKENFGRLLSSLNRGHSIDEALQTAYGKTSAQVFADLHEYLNRKKLFGTVFLTPFEKSGEVPATTPVSEYDAYLMLSDIHMSSHHFVDAGRGYHQLESDDPTRPEAFASAGYLAIQMAQKDAAREAFHKAYDLHSEDAQLCMQLAVLDREAKQPNKQVMEELKRAVELRPDFAEAIFQLAMMEVDARDFDAALTYLGRVGLVGPERMAIFRSALAYTNLQRGNIQVARDDAEAAKRAAKTPAETQSADRLIQLIEARSKGQAAVTPGEKLVRAQGTAVGLRCTAAQSATMSKMGIVIDGKQLLFDMPEPAAVEVTHRPETKAELKCGPLANFPVTVEYAPASVANQQTAGLIRRLEF